MKELEFIEIIKQTLSKSSYIGDDCAHLKELKIVITQDSLVEDIHFSRKFSTPYDIGYKSIIVNISDIFASGAIPKYVTISLSLPNDVNDSFIKEFYNAVDDIAKKFDIEVVGGDITGSDKVFISVCAIGTTVGRNISSRINAHVGDFVILSGVHGSSAAGLWALQNNFENQKLAKNHLSPTPQKKLSEEIATKTTSKYAMMDTSDGLADALFKIAEASNVQISVNFDKIVYDKSIEDIANAANCDFKDWILYGGEDFGLVACISKDDLNKLNKNTYSIIGEVKEKTENYFVEVNFGNNTEKIFDLKKSFNHFKEKE